MGFWNILTCMAGARITGALVASTVQLSMSSEMPTASLAMIQAVAGAITTISAASASAICSRLNSEASSNISVTTGRLVMLRRVSGAMNLVADSVITTSTLAPAWVNLLARSAAL
ncbi:hypothetical protein ES703_64564 [subsurface metagenome]